MDHPDTTEPLWTVREVAQALSVSKQWVYKQAELGKLPCLRLSGGVLRFRPAAIRQWLADLERARLPSPPR
jgi:excisionase family DNA binding protein